MGVASTAFHIFAAMRRAIGRVILWFFVWLVIGAAAIEGVAYFGLGHHNPGIFTHIGAAAIGVLAGYAAALTVIVREAIRFLIATIQTVERDIKGEVGEGAKLLDRVAAEVTGRSKKS